MTVALAIGAHPRQTRAHEYGTNLAEAKGLREKLDGKGVA